MTTPAHIYKTARRQIRKIRHRGAGTEKERALLASADQQRACGLGWRYDGFENVATGEIFCKLAEFGIDASSERFREDALGAGSPTKLGEIWTSSSSAQGRWADYPNMAARELWARLLKEEIRAEVVSDRIDALLERAEVESGENKLKLWFEAARILTDACIRDGAPDREFFREVLREAGGALTGWMEELPPALVGTAFEMEAPELCKAFSHFADGPALLAERAEILLRLGNSADAASEIEALWKANPEHPAVLLKAGGIFESVGRSEEAQICLAGYTKAMEAKRAAARAKVASMQQNGASSAGVIPQSIGGLGRALFGIPKVSPNEPCPCGSGKKFKHCHGMSKH